MGHGCLGAHGLDTQRRGHAGGKGGHDKKKNRGMGHGGIVLHGKGGDDNQSDGRGRGKGPGSNRPEPLPDIVNFEKLGHTKVQPYTTAGLISSEERLSTDIFSSKPATSTFFV